MQDNKKEVKGKIYIVSTPIGNKDDITIRAMNSIKRSDFIICEEIKAGARTLKNLNISKELVALNEHNEIEVTNDIIQRIKNGEKASLISDDGTPLIADPGNYFIRNALRENIEIEVVPGVTSIITALVRSGFATNEFVFAGFVSQKSEEKLKNIKDLANESRTVVLLEAPYRLSAILETFNKIIPNRRAYIGMNLTHPYETHHYGTFEQLYEQFKDYKLKSEFVICFEGTEFRKIHKKSISEKGNYRQITNKKFSDKPRKSQNKFSENKNSRSNFSKRNSEKRNNTKFKK